MINAEQIRMARAFLDWSTAYLAKQSLISASFINKIEREEVVLASDIAEKLQKLFEAYGIEFLPNSGVKEKERIVEIWEGDDARKKVLDDLSKEYQGTGGLFLVAHEDEEQVLEDMGRENVLRWAAERRAANIFHRMLVRASDTGPTAPYEDYHVLPDKYFSEDPIQIYGPKLALSIRKPAFKSIVINDARFADSIRQLFNYIWDHTDVFDPSSEAKK